MTFNPPHVVLLRLIALPLLWLGKLGDFLWDAGVKSTWPEGEE